MRKHLKKKIFSKWMYKLHETVNHSLGKKSGLKFKMFKTDMNILEQDVPVIKKQIIR